MKKILVGALVFLGGCVMPGKRTQVYEYSFRRSPGVVLYLTADECRVRLDETQTQEVVKCYWQTGTGFDTVFEARVNELKYFRRIK